MISFTKTQQKIMQTRHSIGVMTCSATLKIFMTGFGDGYVLMIKDTWPVTKATCIQTKRKQQREYPIVFRQHRVTHFGGGFYEYLGLARPPKVKRFPYELMVTAGRCGFSH